MLLFYKNLTCWQHRPLAHKKLSYGDKTEAFQRSWIHSFGSFLTWQEHFQKTVTCFQDSFISCETPQCQKKIIHGWEQRPDSQDDWNTTWLCLFVPSQTCPSKLNDKLFSTLAILSMQSLSHSESETCTLVLSNICTIPKSTLSNIAEVYICNFCACVQGLAVSAGAIFTDQICRQKWAGNAQGSYPSTWLQPGPSGVTSAPLHLLAQCVCLNENEPNAQNHEGWKGLLENI